MCQDPKRPEIRHPQDPICGILQHLRFIFFILPGDPQNIGSVMETRTIADHTDLGCFVLKLPLGPTDVGCRQKIAARSCGSRILNMQVDMGF